MVVSAFEGFSAPTTAWPRESLTGQFNEKIDGMDADEMTGYICATYDGVNAVEGDGDMFFLYDPDRDLPPERQLPFATIVTGDHYDKVSRLDRPGTYRLNIGLTKATYAARFGAAATPDYAALDTLMPHPEYAAQHWVCVVNPGPATLGTVRELLDEAHAFAARKHANRQARRP
jgi:hypothetical protein